MHSTSTIQRTLHVLIGLIVIIAILFPLINSALSKKYHLVISEEGSNSNVYQIEFDETNLTVSLGQYNDLATQKEGKDTVTNKIANSEDTYKRLAAAYDYFKGAHISVRWHGGYTFFYEDYEGENAFYRAIERADLLELARISYSLSRGDERTSGKHSLTYSEVGSESLSSFLATHNITVPDSETK